MSFLPYFITRLTRDDFLGMVELPLSSMPREAEGRAPPNKYYNLRPRSARSRVRGHLELYHAYVHEENPANEEESEEEAATEVHELEDEGDWEVIGNAERPARVIGGSMGPPSGSVSSSGGVSSGGGGPPLPPGWEERQDANGRT